jgi:hypothetical protein
MIIFKKLAVLLILFSFYNPCIAQYNNYDWNKAAENQIRKANQAYIDARVNTKTTKTYGSNSPSTPQSTPYWMMSREEKATYDKQSAEAKQQWLQRQWDAAQREQDRKDADLRYKQAWEKYYVDLKRSRVQQITNQFANTHFTNIDYTIYAEEAFFYEQLKDADKMKRFNEQYVKAANSTRYWLKHKNSLPYDSLIHYTSIAAFFPDYANIMLKEIKEKFPQKNENLEKLELEILSYYFGRNTRYQTLANDYKYPSCGYELMDDNRKVVLLNRFEELDSKYHSIALLNAGLCRIGFNPYFLYATSSLALTNKSNAKRLAYLNYVFISPEPDRVLPKGGFAETTWKYFADKLLRPAAIELKQLYPTFIEELSPVEWDEISKASQLNIEYIAWAFREDDNDKKYLKRYPNLKNALNDEFKKEEDGEGTITFENRDTYKGEIKNGKPNGEGKLTTATGNIFEGTFKNGALHGKGKAYYKNDVTFKNGPNSAGFKFFAGDRYEGDFDNGLREGKGTLNNKERGTSYVGDWKNDKEHGEGEQIFITNSLKLPNTYKGSFKNGLADGFGIRTYYEGKMYTGNFKEGRYEGKGIIKYADGSTLEGNWDGGNIDGKAIFTSYTGYVVKFENEIKKSYYKRKEYGRSVTKQNIKCYDPNGKEINELEFTKKAYINTRDIQN